MRRIYLNKTTGFKIKDKQNPVIIRDSRGLLFYTTEPILPRAEYFNLPAGEYYIETGNIAEADEPRKYKLASMPPPERDYGSAGDFDVVFAPNPNKCSVYWDEKKIVFDTSFQDMPLPYTMFILYHELGHRYYGADSEHLVDLYASNMMKLRGYNPSQIGQAQMMTLSSRQEPRKEFLFNKLFN